MLAPFSQKQRDYYFRSFDSWFNVAEGGVRAGKNVLNVAAFCRAVDHSPDRLHLIMGPSVSAAQLNVVDCDGFGISFHFAGRIREGKFRDRRALYVQDIHDREKIILVSGANNTRSMRQIKGQSYGCVYITEANECDPDTVKETFNRTIQSVYPQHFHDLNPKPEGHWYYEDVLTPRERTDHFNYGHFTAWDNLSISDEQLQREIDRHDKQSARYKRDILGKRVALEGLIYPMFNPDYHIVPTISRPYSQYWVSMDYGTQNATAIALWGLHDDVYYMISEYYHSGRAENETKRASVYYQELKKLAGNKRIECVVIDPSAAPFIAELNHYRDFRFRRAANDVKRGIEAVADALASGNIKFNDCCTNAIREFGLYRWNSNSVNDEPIKADDHMQDAIRYIVYTLGWGARKRRSGWEY